MQVGELYVPMRLNLTEFDAALRGVEAKIKQAESSLEGFRAAGQRLSSIGTKWTVGVTVPILGIGAAAFKAAADFETMQNTFQTVSHATSSQMQRMSELAKALGNDLTLPGTSASDAAAAMTELVKAGLSIDQTFKAVKGTLQLSAAAQVDNATAATIVGQALNAFKLSGDKAVMVADLLANSANASAGEMTDMAYALQSGGAVAAMAGQSINDFTTAVGLMANAGITGSDAGTSLKTMFMALMSPTKKAAEALADYGIKVYDAHGKMLPLPALVEQFSQKLGGLSQEQRNAALAAIFGTDAVRAANTVLMAGTQAWDDMSTAVNRAGGAQEVAAAKMKGANGAWEAFKSTLETLAITIGEKLLPVVTPLIGKLTQAAEWFGNLSPGMQETIIKVALLAAAIGPLLIVVGQAMQAFVAIKGAIAGVGAALTILTGPVGGAVVAIGALIGVGALLVRNWDSIRAQGIQIWQTFTSALNDMWNNIRAQAISSWNSLRDYLSNIWATIRTTAINAWTNIKQSIVNLVSNWWTIGRDMVQGIINGLKNMIPNAIAAAGQLASAIGNKVKAFFGISSPSALMAEYGRMVAEGLRQGMAERHGAVANQAQLMAQAITGALDTVTQKLDLTAQIAQARFDLLKAKMGETGNQSTLLKAQLEMLQAQLQAQNDKVAVVTEAYNRMKAAKGEAAAETQKLYLQLLQEQKAQVDLQNAITETTKKLQEQTEAAAGWVRGLDGVLKKIAEITDEYTAIQYEGGVVKYSNKSKSNPWREKGYTVERTSTGGYIAVPKWANGGVLTRPTLLTDLATMRPVAIAGEAGPEVVAPAAALAGVGGGMNITVNVYGSVGVKDIAEQLVREIRLRTGLRI